MTSEHGPALPPSPEVRDERGALGEWGRGGRRGLELVGVGCLQCSVGAYKATMASPSPCLSVCSKLWLLQVLLCFCFNQRTKPHQTLAVDRIQCEGRLQSFSSLPPSHPPSAAALLTP